jgi:hypothetical protein
MFKGKIIANGSANTGAICDVLLLPSVSDMCEGGRKVGKYSRQELDVG